jgi:nucleoside 2-deoxyribosyltransferase
MPAIPARLIVGVTGHRRLVGMSSPAERIHDVLDEIRRLVPPMKKTPVVFTALSPLAEGADRLVVEEILKMPDSLLEVVLPFDENDYVQDFSDAESQKEFFELLGQARSIHRLSSSLNRNQAYAQAGRYVVDHSDVLIALWDGAPPEGEGGTATIVEYARAKQCPLYWIRTEGDFPVTHERGRGLNLRLFLSLDAYNSERVDLRKAVQRYEDQCSTLQRQAEQAGFAGERVRQVCERVLEHYYQADLLSLRYQHMYHRAGSTVYALAIAAAGVAALQAVFLPRWFRLALIEVLFIVFILAVVWLGHRREWQTKWIDYRFLAERFRSALFMAICGVGVATLRPPRYLSLSYSDQDWMVSAFLSVWSQIPRRPMPDSAEFNGLKRFIAKAWIEDQISYHEATSERHGRRHMKLTRAGNVLFGLTFAAAVLHVLQAGPELLQRSWLFFAIVCPAVASALGAVRTHREFQRNARRSAEMARHLKELKARMEGAENLADFLPLVNEAEEIMLHENADWRVVFRFHELEPAP